MPDDASLLAAPAAGTDVSPGAADPKKPRLEFFSGRTVQLIKLLFLTLLFAMGWQPCAAKTVSALPDWLSREPLGEGSSVNLYAFVNDDPINHSDYLGLETQVNGAANGNIILSLTSNGAWQSIGSLGADHMVSLSGLGLSGKVSPNALAHALNGLDDTHMSLSDPLTQLQIQSAVFGAQLDDDRHGRTGWFAASTVPQVYNPTWEIERNNRQMETKMEENSTTLFMLVGPQVFVDLVAPEAAPVMLKMLTPLLSKSAAFMMDAGQGIAMGQGLMFPEFAAPGLIDIGAGSADGLTLAGQFGGTLTTDTITGRSTVTTLAKYYPENNGFIGATERKFLMPGQIIDRYGGSGYSRFFSPQGITKAGRALPPGTAGQPLRSFQVLKPFEVDAGTVAPAFGEMGLGTQYVSPLRLEVLLKRGILGELP